MSSDSYGWELQTNKFLVQVVSTVYIYHHSGDGKPTVLCGFLETSNVLHLPCEYITENQYAAEVAVSLFKKHIPIDLKNLDIIPYGFFDPMKPPLSEQERAHRTICLAYQTRIQPGTPVNSDLRFMTYEEIEIARGRIARGHYEAYRTGLAI